MKRMISEVRLTIPEISLILRLFIEEQRKKHNQKKTECIENNFIICIRRNGKDRKKNDVYRRLIISEIT